MRDIIRYLRNSPLAGIGTEAEAAGGEEKEELGESIEEEK